MRKLRLAELIDEQFPAPGNWQGMSVGQGVVVWLAYILCEGDHCLNPVESWAAGLLKTLSTGLGGAVRALDIELRPPGGGAGSPKPGRRLGRV